MANGLSNVIFYNQLKCRKHGTDNDELTPNVSAKSFVDLERETKGFLVTSTLRCAQCNSVRWQRTWLMPRSKSVSVWLEGLRLSTQALSGKDSSGN